MSLVAQNIVLVIAVALVLAGGALIWTALAKIIGDRSSVTRRLENGPGQAQAEIAAGRATIEDNLLRRFSRFVTPAADEELSASRQRLAKAGFRRPSAVRVFHVGRAGSAIVFLFLGLIALPTLSTSFPMPIPVVLLLVACCLGFAFPSILLDQMISARRSMAERGFPEALDLLLVCIESGQSFDQAARRLARELANHNKVLSEELTIVNEQLWAGKERSEVFHEFAQRIDVNDITAFVTVLRQADRFGVSIAEAIRVYAGDMRFKRVMRAEEKANTMPLKIALASIMFTVPPTIVIMIAPSFVNIANSFTTM